jgi:hypothetical protein
VKVRDSNATSSANLSVTGKNFKWLKLVFLLIG